MNDLEFEYALREYIARAKKKLSDFNDDLDGTSITLEANGVDRVNWRLDKYRPGPHPNYCTSGADLMLCVNNFITLYSCESDNSDLRLLPKPANPDNSPEENVNAGTDEKVSSDDIPY